MIRFSPATRITLGLVMITICLLLGADFAGLLPDTQKALLESRKKICESLAVYGALAAEKGETELFQSSMEIFHYRNRDVLSLGLRDPRGAVVLKVGEHERYWTKSEGDFFSPNHIQVPIHNGKQLWGTLEVSFRETGRKGLLPFLDHSIFGLLIFMVPLCCLGYLFFLRRTLRHLDPSSVIPVRVQAALDALAEGVLILDRGERIVLANAAFATAIGSSTESLIGRKASEISWVIPKSKERPKDFPWIEAAREGVLKIGIPLAVETGEKGFQTFVVNGAPVTDGKGNIRGAMATFSNVTQLEIQNDRLQEMLKLLEESRNKVEEQNKKLKILASYDPLTLCLNRRSFFEILESKFKTARSLGQPLSSIMVDIDHFKSINDNHGHQTGDRVLKEVAKRLRAGLRDNDLICRYGGEEFCILLPEGDADRAVIIAERLKGLLSSSTCAEIPVTASFGVSSIMPGVGNAQELIHQADVALYEAKARGRNRVVSARDIREKERLSDTGDNRQLSIRAA